MAAIECTIMKLLCLVTERSYCPVKIGTLDYFVDFAKGSPGLIPVLVLAGEIFPEI